MTQAKSELPATNFLGGSHLNRVCFRNHSVSWGFFIWVQHTSAECQRWPNPIELSVSHHQNTLYWTVKDHKRVKETFLPFVWICIWLRAKKSVQYSYYGCLSVVTFVWNKKNCTSSLSPSLWKPNWMLGFPLTTMLAITLSSNLVIALPIRVLPGQAQTCRKDLCLSNSKFQSQPVSYPRL